MRKFFSLHDLYPNAYESINEVLNVMQSGCYVFAYMLF